MLPGPGTWSSLSWCEDSHHVERGCETRMSLPEALARSEVVLSGCAVVSDSRAEG
jgi:hypothetical protein